MEDVIVKLLGAFFITLILVVPFHFLMEKLVHGRDDD